MQTILVYGIINQIVLMDLKDTSNFVKEGVLVNKQSKIGVFDSGLGGISVLFDIHRIMPNEALVYIGDSINAPYGIKSKEEVFLLSKSICDELISNEDVKAIVIACNTATSAAVDRLRSMYSIPIIGMEPAVKPAIEATKGTIAVLATEMTLREEKFERLINSLEENQRILKIPAPKMVEVVENSIDDIDQIMKVLNLYFDNINYNVEAVVLGCTHFIFLRDYIESYYKSKIEIFDGNVGTVYQLRNVLSRLDLLSEEENEGEIKIYNSKGDDYVKKSYEMYEYLRVRKHGTGRA